MENNIENKANLIFSYALFNNNYCNIEFFLEENVENEAKKQILRNKLHSMLNLSQNKYKIDYIQNNDKLFNFIEQYEKTLGMSVYFMKNKPDYSYLIESMLTFDMPLKVIQQFENKNVDDIIDSLKNIKNDKKNNKKESRDKRKKQMANFEQSLKKNAEEFGKKETEEYIDSFLSETAIELFEINDNDQNNGSNKDPEEITQKISEEKLNQNNTKQNNKNLNNQKNNLKKKTRKNKKENTVLYGMPALMPGTPSDDDQHHNIIRHVKKSFDNVMGSIFGDTELYMIDKEIGNLNSLKQSLNNYYNNIQYHSMKEIEQILTKDHKINNYYQFLNYSKEYIIDKVKDCLNIDLESNLEQDFDNTVQNSIDNKNIDNNRNIQNNNGIGNDNIGSDSKNNPNNENDNQDKSINDKIDELNKKNKNKNKIKNKE